MNIPTNLYNRLEIILDGAGFVDRRLRVWQTLPMIGRIDIDGFRALVLYFAHAFKDQGATDMSTRENLHRMARLVRIFLLKRGYGVPFTVNLWDEWNRDLSLLDWVDMPAYRDLWYDGILVSTKVA